jgi:molybdopterin synthase catalytic subunit
MGKIEVRIDSEPIALSEVVSWWAEPSHGAMNLFVGRVRSSNLGRAVVAMEYDCYAPLCQRTLIAIAGEARKKWCEDANILILHRYGRVAVGEASVAIVATTGHRDESYRITRYIIEELKTRAPIWKKEFYQDGETDWVQGHALCQHRKVDHHEAGGGHSCGGKVHPHAAR